jgi:uncharacterized membrane protein
MHREDSVSENLDVDDSLDTQTRNDHQTGINWEKVLSWIITIILVIGMILAALKMLQPKIAEVPPVSPDQNNQIVPLPGLISNLTDCRLSRFANIKTDSPDGVRHNAVKYTVQSGDSIFVIAEKFNISAETILWANYSLLNDDPTFLMEGWRLNIPPTNGIYWLS